MDSKALTTGIMQYSGSDAKKVSEFLSTFAKIIAGECGNENKIAIPGFGTFEGTKHDEKIAQDLTSGKNLLLPPSIELGFKASGMLKKKIKEEKI